MIGRMHAMTFLPRLTTLLLIGAATLFFVGGAVGAQSLGLTREQVPTLTEAARQAPAPAPAAAIPVVPAAGNELAMGAAAAPGSAATEVSAPVAAQAAQDQPQATDPAPAQPGAQVLQASGAGVALSADRPVLRRPSDTATITAVVTDAAGTPLAGVPVTFSLDDPEIGQLTAAQGVTDASGVATTTFAPEVFRGAATITAATAAGSAGRVTIGIACGC